MESWCHFHSGAVRDVPVWTQQSYSKIPRLRPSGGYNVAVRKHFNAERTQIQDVNRARHVFWASELLKRARCTLSRRTALSAAEMWCVLEVDATRRKLSYISSVSLCSWVIFTHISPVTFVVFLTNEWKTFVHVFSAVHTTLPMLYMCSAKPTSRWPERINFTLIQTFATGLIGCESNLKRHKRHFWVLHYWIPWSYGQKLTLMQA